MNDLTVRFKVNFRKSYRRDKGTAAAASEDVPKKTGKSKSAIATKPGATRIARMLALAYFVERQVEAEKIRDYATAARRLGISRARITQVMNLLNLPVPLQESILAGGRDICERQLRKFYAHQWEITGLVH